MLIGLLSVVQTSDKEDNNQSDKDKALLKRAYKYFFAMAVFFFLSAILGNWVGNYIDEQFGTEPFGKIVTFICFYVVSLGTAVFATKYIDKS